jgi:hypothetical protein
VFSLDEVFTPYAQSAELEKEGRLVVTDQPLHRRDSRAGDHVGDAGLLLQGGPEVFEWVADPRKVAQAGELGGLFEVGRALAQPVLGAFSMAIRHHSLCAL